MNRDHVFVNDFVGRSTYATSHLRRITISRLDGIVSPFERWPDNNYAPRELDYVINETLQSSEIIAPVHGYKADEIHITISRGHVIILFSRPDPVSNVRDEYYCEVPLPNDVWQNSALADIGSRFLTVRLGKKRTLFSRAAALGRRVRNDVGLLFGTRLSVGHLDV